MSGWIVPVKDGSTYYTLNSNTFYITTEMLLVVVIKLSSPCTLTVLTLQVLCGDLVTGDITLLTVHLITTL